MLERQIMFKQLQELQRQKKLKELNDGRPQNVIDQLSLMHNKHSSGAQYALVNRGIPVRDASQMFMFGDTNSVHRLSNGLVYSQAQNHFQGSSRESSGLLTKDNNEQARTFSKPFIGDQFNASSDQERSLFGPAFSQVVDIKGQTGRVQQVNNHDRYASSQEFPVKTENVSGNQDLANLDPLEQKVLFNKEDNSWGTSFGKHGNEKFENTHNSSDGPSLQSGSWSALMQSAVAEATNGDAGLQEEWSGLSFQSSELSNGNQPSNFLESGKHPTPWLCNKLPKSELQNTSNASSNVPGFQHFQNPKTGNMHSDSNHKEAGQGFLPDIQRNVKTSEDASFKSNGYSGMSGFVDISAGFSDPNSTAQASHNMLELIHKVDKEYTHGTVSSYTDSALITDVPKAQPDDAFTPSYNNSSSSQYFGLRLAPPSQRPLGHSGSQSFNPNASQETSHLVQVKNEDGKQSSTFASSTRPPNIWVDVPLQQNPFGIGSCEPPSTPCAGNSRMVTGFEALKKRVKRGNNFLETDAHVINSQGPDDGRGFASKTYFGKETLSGNLEANTHHHNHSLLNPMNYDPSMRAAIKNETVNYEDIIPQETSLSQPNSAYGNHRSHPISSAATGDHEAPSWLKNNEASKTEQTLSMYDANAAQRLYVKGFSGSLERNSSLVQVANNDQCGSVGPITGTNEVAVTHSSSIHLQHLDVANQNMVVLNSKKRKFPTFERLPWHKEVTESRSKLHDMSTAEREWAHSVDRLPEKLKEVADSLRMVRQKRRVILTTQLMQLLFWPAPAIVLSEDVTAHCDTVTYYAAKLTLGDACSLASHSHMPHDISGSSSGKSMTSKSSVDQDLSKTVTGFIDRLKRLEDELSRLEKEESSILDVRVEYQDLEKFSVINRFAKFHSRGPLVTGDTSSSGGASTMLKLYPQRYVTASPMPSTVPEGLRCLLL